MAGSWTPEDADLALRAAGHAVVVSDRDNRIRFWNDAATQLFGWDPDETVGRELRELVHPRPLDSDGDSSVRHAPGGGRIVHFHALRKDGTVVPVVGIGRPIEGPDGVPIGRVKTFLDISDRVNAEAAAAAAATRLEIVRAITGIGTWEWDLETGEITGDRSLSEIHGTDPDRPWTIDGWFDAMHPDDRERMIEVASAVFDDDQRSEVRYRVVRPDGSTRVVLGRAEIIAWRDGAPVRLGGVVVDVTESHRDAQRVLDNLETMSDGYLSVDPNWIVTYVNRAGEAFLGEAREHMLGRNLWEVFPEAVGSEFYNRYLGAMESREATEFEAYYEPHEAWYEIHAYPNDGALAIYFRNINDRRARIEAQERLLMAERATRVATEAASRKLEQAATHDHLTGLANRVALERHLAVALARGTNIAVLFCDLDRFKNVNDGLGHGAGDEILVQVARRLASCARAGDLVARIGGDEFVVAARVAECSEALAIAQRLIDVVGEPVDVSGRHLVTTMSVGIALGNAGSTPQTLLRDADAAVYRAKDHGRNQASVFDDALRSAAIGRLEIEHDLRVALAEDQLAVVYQPAFDLHTARVVGVEALVRWHHPTRGLVVPGEFIPLAEETGLIVPLGRRVLDLVAHDVTAGRLGVPHDFTCWVNVSGRELVEPNYFDELGKRNAMLGARLGLEITETVLIKEPEVGGNVLDRIASEGVKIAIDDFGTGYSSFARLADYRIDLVKIDKSFVDQLDSTKHRAIVAATIDIAHALGADAVAEGVETPVQLRWLRSLGCDWVSGFLLARPVPAADLAGAIATGEELLTETLSRRPTSL
jgi:diguanylate cyclase (GGDEF)-like protein/PAS domain S-box-containing protein